MKVKQFEDLDVWEMVSRISAMIKGLINYLRKTPIKGEKLRPKH